jgi:hypothetical protein
MLVPGRIRLKKDSAIANIIYILIAGMGNVKHGQWQGIIIYFSAITLLGIGLLFVEQNLIIQYYEPSRTVRTFLILIYIAFAFFWNGTGLLSSEVKNRILTRNKNNLEGKNPRERHNKSET